jgi:hypothetical protein
MQFALPCIVAMVLAERRWDGGTSALSARARLRDKCEHLPQHGYFVNAYRMSTKYVRAASR